MSRADLATAIRRASRGQIKATERGIRGWEKNEYTPHGESVPAIASALGCDIEQLYETTVAASDDTDDEDSLGSMTIDQLLERRLDAILAKRARVREEVRETVSV